MLLIILYFATLYDTYILTNYIYILLNILCFIVFIIALQKGKKLFFIPLYLIEIGKTIFFIIILIIMIFQFKYSASDFYLISEAIILSIMFISYLTYIVRNYFININKVGNS